MRIEATITISLSEYNRLKKIEQEHEVLKVQITELATTVATLKEQIRLLQNGKNSGTSHTPPSHQIGRSNATSLRVKTERKSGGQPGHEGTTLQIKEVPDETINYSPAYCNGCGEDLQQAVSVLYFTQDKFVHCSILKKVYKSATQQ